MWSWDITYLNGPVKGVYFFLYMVMDIFSRCIVGWEVWEEQTGEHASTLISKACHAQRIPLGSALILHSDNGSPMKSCTLLAKLEDLGVMPSFSRPHVSNDNPFSESVFKTCKYRPNFLVEGFASLQEARDWWVPPKFRSTTSAIIPAASNTSRRMCATRALSKTLFALAPAFMRTRKQSIPSAGTVGPFATGCLLTRFH